MSGDAYHVERRGNVCDVTIYDHLTVYHHETGKEYDFDEYTLPGVPWFDGIEDNIREHFQAWRAHAAAFTAQRAVMLEIIDRAASMAGPAVFGEEVSACL